MAYRVRQKILTLIYLSDSDKTALCGPTSLCIHSFFEEKGSKKKRKMGNSEMPICTYEVTGGSNIFMEELKSKIEVHIPSSEIIYTEANIPFYNQILLLL